MSALLNSEDQAALCTIQAVVEQAPELHPAALIEYASNSAVLMEAYENSLGLSNRHPKYVADRAVQLLEIAQDQTHQLLRAAELVIPRKAVSKVELPGHIAQVLRSSSEIGAQFGRVSSMPRHRGEKNDEYILGIMRLVPEKHLSYDGQKVALTDQGQALFHHDRPGDAKGCPAMRVSVNRNDRTVNLYRLFWSGFTEEYIADHVMQRNIIRRVFNAI